MQSWCFLSVICVLFFLVPGNCRHIPETPTEKSVNRSIPCNIEADSICSSIDVSHNYSLELDVDYFHSFGEIKVKVHMNQCILSGIQSPWWYQLEFIEKLGNGSLESGSDVAAPSSFHRNTDATESEYGREKSSSRTGKFRVPRQNYEVQLCDKDTTVAFSSCSPTPLDFPRQYIWKKATNYDQTDSLCFRLTLQINGEKTCSQKETCISISEIPQTKPTSSFNGVVNRGHSSVNIVSDLEQIGSADYDPFEFMDEDMNDDEDLIMQRINESYLNADKEVVVTARGCLVARKFYIENNLPWSPDCDCEGYYKTVQCLQVDENLQCWCSTRSGSEISNTRKTLNCDEPHYLDFKCW